MPSPLVTYSKLPGVSDLPLAVRGPFAQALIAEDNGDHSKAAEKLEQAIIAEDNHAKAGK
jgi:hypothetical protein